MKYFKVQHGFHPTDYISINEDELQKAIYAHIKGINVVFRNGSISGNNILFIKEDFNKAMGWNLDHKPNGEDMAEIYSKCTDYKGMIAEAKSKVHEIIQTKQIHLLGKMDQILPAPKEKKYKFIERDDNGRVYMERILVE